MDNELFATLYEDFANTYEWVVNSHRVSVSRSIAHSVLRSLDQADPIFLRFINHYPLFFNRPSVAARTQFDVTLHVQVIEYLLVRGGSKAQPALLALIAEVGLKIGLEIETLCCVAPPGERAERMSRQPRLLDIVQAMPLLGDPRNQTLESRWFVCRLPDCQKGYLRRSSLEKHLREDHKYSHTEIFEVFRDPAHAGAQLQSRFGPFKPQELDSIGYDIATLRDQRNSKRKRSRSEVEDSGTTP